MAGSSHAGAHCVPHCAAGQDTTSGPARNVDTHAVTLNLLSTLQDWRVVVSQSVDSPQLTVVVSVAGGEAGYNREMAGQGGHGSARHRRAPRSIYCSHFNSTRTLLYCTGISLVVNEVYQKGLIFASRPGRQ